MNERMSLSTLLAYYATLWQRSLDMERTLGLQLRMPFSFPDIDRFGEALCGLLTGLKGSGTKGSGADLSDGRIQDEVKTVCLCQPSRCLACKKRSPWTHTVCSHCGSAELERMSDSRFGLNAAAHLKDKDTLRNYWCVALEHVSGDGFQITAWTLDASNPYFNAYIEEQAKQSSKTCNMLPRSYDFVMSGATRVFRVEMTLPSDLSVAPTVGEIDQTITAERLSCAVLRKSERVALGLAKTDETTCVSVEDAVKVLSLRKKTHGKLRGTTTRGIGETP
jgi:hypothetical protein